MPPITPLNPIAQYRIYVRDTNRNLVGELDAYDKVEFLLRFNAVSDWQIDLSAKHAMAGYLATRGYGIIVNRTVLDPNTGVELDNRTLLSGPIRGWRREKIGNKLIVSGKDDMAWLAMRDAWTLNFYPYSFDVENFAGCIRHYKLAEASGTTMTDSKSAVNGTYTNSPTLGVASLIDDSHTAATFNGTNQYGSAANTSLPSGTGAWTVTGWVSVAGLPASGSWSHICGWGTAVAGQAVRMMVYNNAGTGNFIFSSSGNDVTGTGSVPIVLGTTYFVAITYNGTTVTVYINGVQIATGTPTLNVTLGTNNFYIGSVDGTQFYFNGTVEEVSVHNQAMSAANVLTLYNVGRMRFAHQAYDTRVGVAETIMKAYVDNNAIIATNDPQGLSRNVPGLSSATSAGLGSSITGNARFDPLVNKDGTGLLQSLAQQSSPPLGFKVVQTGTNLVYSAYVPSDKSGAIVFSDDLGNLADFKYEVIAPDLDTGGNQVVVGGGGQGVGRTFVVGSDTASIAAWGRAEGFGDARDTTDLPTLAQRVTENLAKFKETVSFSAVLAPTQSMTYGVDFNLGDKVTVVVDGTAFVDIVREVDILLDPSGAETVTPSIGTPVNATPTDALDLLARQLRLALSQTIKFMRVQ